MRYWNGLNKNDIIYYNDKQYRVIELLEKNSKRMCKIQNTEDSSISLEVLVQDCNKEKQ